MFRGHIHKKNILTKTLRENHMVNTPLEWTHTANDMIDENGLIDVVALKTAQDIIKVISHSVDIPL